jgi:hypothetical protein
MPGSTPFRLSQFRMSFLLCLRHHALLVLGDVDAVSHGLVECPPNPTW